MSNKLTTLMPCKCYIVATQGQISIDECPTHKGSIGNWEVEMERVEKFAKDHGNKHWWVLQVKEEYAKRSKIKT